MSQTKKEHCELLVAVWLRPSTTGPCICCKQVAEKPRGEHLMYDVCMYLHCCLFTYMYRARGGGGAGASASPNFFGNFKELLRK